MTIQIQFDTSYLNRTENKSTRTLGAGYLARVWHETAGYGSLQYNLPRSIGSSYDFLIKRSGRIFHYLDHKRYTSWDTGVSAWEFDGTLYRNWDLNFVTLGIELEGPNDGTLVTAAQLDSAALLALWLEETEGIDLSGTWDVTHAQIAPGRKSDPRGYTVDQVLVRARAMKEPDYAALWGDRAAYEPTWGIPTEYRRQHAAGRPLGQAVTPELHHEAAKVAVQLFEQGAIVWSALGGAQTYRRDG